MIPQQVLALFIMSLHVTTYYLLHAASGRANKPNNPKMLSVYSDMSLFGSLESVERSATEISVFVGIITPLAVLRP